MHSFGKGGGTLEKPETENKGEPRKCVIDVKDLYKIYPIGKNEVRALNGVSFQVYEGEFCAIVGASGSGKSTLLNMLAGLEKPTKGQIMVAGERIEGEQTRTVSQGEDWIYFSVLQSDPDHERGRECGITAGISWRFQKRPHEACRKDDRSGRTEEVPSA